MKPRDRIVALHRVKASELLENPQNWRQHPAEQRSGLEAVLGEIGFAGAALAYRDADGRLVLIDGHLRRDVAGDAEIPVLETDLTEDEADALLATYDPLGAMAEANADRLHALLDSLKGRGPDLSALLQSLRPPDPKAGQTDPDAVPDPPPEPITKPGDLWLLGDHRLLCGDATSAEDVARLLDGTVPFLMVTDPPYGVDYDPAWRTEARGLWTTGGKVRDGEVRNDDRADWSEAWLLFPGDVVYVWHSALMAPVVAASLVSADFHARAHIVWRKPYAPISRGHYHWQHEPCWYCVRKGTTARWVGDRKQSTVWEMTSPNDPYNRSGEGYTFHGTQKPVEAMSRPIQNHGQAGDDPFLGSGTTLIAAEQLGRRCYAIEIEPRYCDVAVKRWEAFTGKRATRERRKRPTRKKAARRP